MKNLDEYWYNAETNTAYNATQNKTISANAAEYIDFLQAGGQPRLGARNAPLTPEELQADFTTAIQAHLDRFAQTRNYDNIMSAATYATSIVPKFRAEGQYAVEARDLTWAKGYELLDAVLSGSRPMPDLEEVIAELPALAWPEG